MPESPNFNLSWFRTTIGQRHAEKRLNFGDSVHLLLNRKYTRIVKHEGEGIDTYVFWERIMLGRSKRRGGEFEKTLEIKVNSQGDLLHSAKWARESPHVYALAIRLRYLRWKRRYSNVSKWIKKDGYSWVWQKHHDNKVIECWIFDAFGKRIRLPKEIINEMQLTIPEKNAKSIKVVKRRNCYYQ